MRILLSNDDGIRAPGLMALASALREIAHVTVVAPERNRSGASNALTLERPLRVESVAADCYAVDGTPADCVNLALTGALDLHPDLVVSGINAGENLGEDVLYSGTVAAAMEGALRGLPAFAVSLAMGGETGSFDRAASLAARFVARVGALPPSKGTLLNINIPAGVGDAQWVVTRLGRRHRDTRSVRQLDPRSRPMYWIGPIGSPGFDGGPGTDFHAVSQGFVSITPLHTDLTAYSLMEDLNQWLTTECPRLV
ncbi:MAG: 5'/3'-nucleotidase SurE [Gammaproteobacteria bacterium]